MIDLTRLIPEALSDEPYRWGFIDGLFSPADGKALVDSFPRDHFKTIKGYDGEKGYEYEARSLMRMGADSISYLEWLSPPWRQLAEDLLSPLYRGAMSRMTGLNLYDSPMEVNLSHYGRKAWLGPHVDLADKVVTHVFYFNDSWDVGDGGCLTILSSSDVFDVASIIPPLIGNSAVVVRSIKSWHAVSSVRSNCRTSRRSMAVTFYRPGSVSTMWPEGDQTPLHDYRESSWLGRWLKKTHSGSGSKIPSGICPGDQGW